MINFLKNKKIKNDKRGFTLLFAVLVSIMILAVGASIINIALKQVILSGSGRESQFAFYAANTGLECALYWDLNGTVVDENGNAEYVFPPSGSNRRNDVENINCSGTNLESGDSGYSQSYTLDGWDVTDPDQTVFRIAISNDLSNFDNTLYCAEVTVLKEVDASGSITTTITSQGLNTCEPDNNPRAVQRGLVLRYNS